MQKPLSAPPGVQYLTITADQAGQRIDNFLLALANGVPRSHIYRVIRTGQVRVNKARIRPTYRLEAEDQVRVPPLRMSPSAQITVPDPLVRRLEGAVIEETPSWLVLNKPPGLAVHAGSGLTFGVIEALRQSRKGSGGKPELAHRLDRATSGCLLVGKHARAARSLQQAFRDRSVQKIYTALVAGRWPEQQTTISKPLRRFEESGGQRRVVVDAGGKVATSVFALQRYWREYDVSLVSVEILTGRTHQIRVHAASEGHPVVGDSLYGDRERNQTLKQRGFDRMYLHCARLVLDIDEDQVLDVSAPLDEQWSALVERMNNGAY